MNLLQLLPSEPLSRYHSSVRWKTCFHGSLDYWADTHAKSEIKALKRSTKEEYASLYYSNLSFSNGSMLHERTVCNCVTATPKKATLQRMIYSKHNRQTKREWRWGTTAFCSHISEICLKVLEGKWIVVVHKISVTFDLFLFWGWLPALSYGVWFDAWWKVQVFLSCVFHPSKATDVADMKNTCRFGNYKI